MKVLILGGTGTISYDVTNRFVENGHEVFLINRGSRNDIASERVHYFRGDVFNNDFLREILENTWFDVIVDFLMFNADQMAQRLPILSDKCEQYIFISSATVYQNTNERITESVPISNDGWGYARGKAECEKYLVANKDEFGFYYTIVRPYYTYDHRRLFFPLIHDRTSRGYYTLLHRLLSHKPVIVCGNEEEDHRFNLTSSRDFAIALEGLLLNPQAINEDFHITSDFTTSWKEILAIIEKKINVKCEGVFIPCDFLEKYYPVGKEEIANGLAYDHIFDNSKIHRAVPGYKSSISIGDGLSKSVEYLLEKKDFFSIDREWDYYEDAVIHLWEASQKQLIHKSPFKSLLYYRIYYQYNIKSVQVLVGIMSSMRKIQLRGRVE